MRLSTIVNFFTPPCDTSRKACVRELEHCKQLGFECLDAVMYTGPAPGARRKRRTPHTSTLKRRKSFHASFHHDQSLYSPV